MIDYIKLYSETKTDTEFAILLTLFLFFILIIIVEFFCRYYDENEKGIVYIFGIVSVILISVGVSYYKNKKSEPIFKAKALKYNVKNIDNLGKNIEVLEKEFKFFANKEEQINKTLNEFYKPTGKNLNNEIYKKLKN
jgi:hypothetical protein